MKRGLVVWTLLISGVIGAPSVPMTRPASAPPAILRWNNGETVTGELIEASAADLQWKTPLFDEPLRLRFPALHRIDQPLAPIADADPFAFTLRDGSSIHGDLLSMTETSVAIRSARHGDAVLKRSELLSMRRIHGSNVIFAGPSGDVGWEIVAGGKKPSKPKKTAEPLPKIPPLITGAGGALEIPYWNRSAYLNLALPELVDVEFRVRSSALPDFCLSLEAEPKQQMTIETWDDELVLRVKDQFKVIRKLAENENEIALHVCWNRKTHACSVFTAGGELLTDWMTPRGLSISAKLPESSENDGSGLLLQNKGRDLALEFLCVRTWNGTALPKIDTNKPRVELADGRIIEGQVSTGGAESIKLRTSASEPEATFAANEVDAVIFSADRPQRAAPEMTFSFADGTIVNGRLSSIREARAAIETSFTNGPLPSAMHALRQLLIHVPATDGTTLPVLADLDKIVVQQTTLHGTLSGAGEDQPRWLPVGGVASAILSKASPSEITRALPPHAPPANTPALFYMSTGDVLPGNLRSLDRSGVEFESSFIETTKLPANNLDAIQFGTGAGTNLRGFGDAGWRILKGDEKTVRKTDESLSMEPETAIGHPSAMQSGEIEFMLVPANTFSTLRLRLFCAGLDGTKSANLLLSYWGNRIQSGFESTEGQLENEFQTIVPQGEPVRVRVIVSDKQMELHVNDVLTRKLPIDPAKRAGFGLIIEPTSIWGNPARAIALSSFSAISSPGRTLLPDVSNETRTQALTVPRFRKDDPPRHVLLAANGDVLRGEIEAATATHFAFRSGLENLRVPRERVKAAIWLKKPVEDSAASAPENSAPKGLEQRIERQTRYSGAGLNPLIGFLQREAPDLKFKLPDKEDERRFQMQFGGQTIGEALDEICSLFSLRYRLASDGMIILEAATPALANDLMQKVYLLGAAAFPSGTSPQDILTAKGVAFPQGAAAIWKPNVRQLTVTNTAANHAKLVEVLEANFGGVLGSPTHWLLLTSGARLGLTVDKFEQDFIAGHHPIYGRCKVPISQVYVIRTSMPEPTAAMKSLADWRLVFAREPVLPQTGGESSPMLGKAAKPFKLPLLGGGDFDLAQEKGKVVVLDFWATWCGPCVKALPGLIQVMSEFPSDQVKLIGVNQSEPPEQVKRFLETRGWKLSVAMDAGQSVARQYGVDGIPHTVIIAPDGKVAWVKTGYSAEGETEAANAVKQLLAPTSQISQ